MLVLSSKGRTLGPILVVILGFLGLWLGSHFQFWLGFMVFLVAAAVFVVMSHRDLQPTEPERRIGWQRIREYGKLRYVGRQILVGVPFLLFLLAIDLFGPSQSDKGWNPRWFATLSALMIGGTVMLSLWYWQERRYAEPASKRSKQFHEHTR